MEISLTTRVQQNLTLEILEEDLNIFVDPYESVWMKIVATFFYLIGILGSIIIYDFLQKEVEDQNKTIINLLLVWAYLLIIFLATFLTGLDLIRAWIGPFPLFICQLQNILKGTVVFSFFCTLFSIFVLKFFFIVIWSKMKIINDFLLWKIIVQTTVFIGKFLRF